MKKTQPSPRLPRAQSRPGTSHRSTLCCVCWIWALPWAAQAQSAEDICRVKPSGATPPYTLHVDQTVKVEDALGSGWIMLAPIVWECVRSSDHETDLKVQPVVVVNSRGVASGTTIHHAGESYRRFVRSQNGEEIGYIARWRSVIRGQASDWTPVTEAVLQEDASGAAVRVGVANGNTYTASVEIQLQPFKIHAAWPSPNATVSFAPLQTGLITQKKLSGSHADTVQPVQSPTVTMAFPYIHRACTTPDVDVRLPTVSADRLPDVNSTGPIKTFDLRFENCPAGLNSIQYQFRSIPHQTIVNGVLPLLDTSTAAGVSVQVLDARHDPLVFDDWYPLVAYDPARDAATYTVELGARIIRTHSALRAGSVHAAMNVTLEYR